MATNNNFKKKDAIKDTEGGNFGNYKEGVGGGDSPKAKDPQQRAPGVNSEHRQENNDTMQPRTNDGKFTYKSVNGKSIDPKYGPSRGKTVNPLLTGGKNGVKIDEVEKQFSEQKGNYWDQYKDSWYQQGSEKIAQGKKGKLQTKVAGESVWNTAKKIFNEVTGEFGGHIEFEHQLGNGGVKKGSGEGGLEESKEFDETKKGAPNVDEKTAKQQAQASNSETYVIEKTNEGIKVMKGKGKPAPAPIQPTPAPAPQQSPVAPSVPNQPEQPVAQPQEQMQIPNEPALTPEEQDAKAFEEFKQKVKNSLGKEYDENFLTDDMIKEFWEEEKAKNNKA